MAIDPDQIETVVAPVQAGAAPVRPATPPKERFEPGPLLASRCRIISRLGRGEVLRAADLVLGRPLALKLLPESAKSNVNLLTRFCLLRRIGRLPSDKAIEFARKLCPGVAAPHPERVLHRDLKPANIMIDARGELRITDFGLPAIAAQVQGNEIRNGTPAYTAPEQLTGREVSVQSDLNAVGLILYETFTGKLPFEADSIAEMLFSGFHAAALERA